MAIDPHLLSSLAAEYTQSMTSIRGRRVRRLVRREFAGADRMGLVQLGERFAAVLGASAPGAALGGENTASTSMSLPSARSVRLGCLLCLVVAVWACRPVAAQGGEPIVGGPCEGCDAIFDRSGPLPVGQGRIAPPGAPGEPLVLSGVVRDNSGHARRGIVVYAYQTDAAGLYPPNDVAPNRAGRRHGRYRGWVQTDHEGRYAFETVRPGGYPNADLPQHIHMHVLEPGCATYYLEDVTFADDPRMTDARRREFASGRGSSGHVVPERVDGVWRVRRDIELGRGIAGHPGCR